MMARRVLLLGGGGFIGKEFARLFAGRYERVVVVDRFSGPAHPRPDAYEQFVRDVDSSGVQTIIADAAHVDSLGNILASVDSVAIMNADTGTANSFERPSDTVRENINALVSVALAIRRFANPSRTSVVFTSSRAVYGEGNWQCAEHGAVRIDRNTATLAQHQFEPRCATCGKLVELRGTPEDHPTIPVSVYGATKRSGEDLLTTLLVPAGFELRILRFQNVFGPGQEVTNPYTGVLNWFSQRLVANEPVEIYERGHILRDFIFCEDAARLLQVAMDFRHGSGTVLHVNGGSGRPVSLRDMALELKQIYSSRSAVADCDKYRIGDVLGACADMTRAENLFGFRCNVERGEGLRRYASWFASQVGATR